MSGRIVRTLGVAAVAGILLGGLVLPGLDALGRTLLMPPVYYPAARGLLVAMWLVGVAATWVYRPPEPPGD